MPVTRPFSRGLADAIFPFDGGEAGSIAVPEPIPSVHNFLRAVYDAALLASTELGTRS